MSIATASTIYRKTEGFKTHKLILLLQSARRFYLFIITYITCYNTYVTSQAKTRSIAQKIKNSPVLLDNYHKAIKLKKLYRYHCYYCYLAKNELY